MDANWIVVANAGRARLFSQAKVGAPLEELEELKHAASRLRTTDTESDDLGRRSGRNGHGAGPSAAPSGYEPHQTPAEHQSELFARTVASKLSEGRNANRFDRLIIAASPEFLGMLRKQLDPKLAAMVRLEIDKDYTQLAPAQLREQLDARRIGA